jgi:uncharacterized protein YndB with AHSA1/START domain
MGLTGDHLPFKRIKSFFVTPMKALRIILFICIGLSALYIVLCFLGPSKLQVSATQTIKAPVATVFPLVADFSQWSAWSPWKHNDSTMTYVPQGTPGAVGHKTSWTSRREGNGHQEIIALRPNAYIKMDVHFSENQTVVATSEWFFSGDSTHTEVRWELVAKDEPFWVRGLLLGFGVEGVLSDYYKSGLKELGAIAEDTQLKAIQ